MGKYANEYVRANEQTNEIDGYYVRVCICLHIVLAAIECYMSMYIRAHESIFDLHYSGSMRYSHFMVWK